MRFMSWWLQCQPISMHFGTSTLVAPYMRLISGPLHWVYLFYFLLSQYMIYVLLTCDSLKNVRSSPSIGGLCLVRPHFRHELSPHRLSHCHNRCLDRLMPQLRHRPMDRTHQMIHVHIASHIEEGVQACIMSICTHIRRVAFMIC